MAVAVPLLMSATGASAAIGAAVGMSAMAVTALTTVAFSVTGLSSKINKAASKVFGEDLVKIGNIFGAAYMAFDAAGSFGGDGAAATAGGTVSKAALDGTSAFGANSVDGAFNLGEMAGAAGEVSALGATDLAAATMDQANAIAQMGGDAGEFLAASGLEAGPGGFNLASGSGLSGEGSAAAAAEAAPQSVVPDSGAASNPGQSAAGTNAAGTNAAAPIQGPGKTPGDFVREDRMLDIKNAAKAPRGFFDRLMFNDKGQINSGVVLGLGQGATAALNAQQAKKRADAELAEQRRRMNQSTGTRITN